MPNRRLLVLIAAVAAILLLPASATALKFDSVPGATESQAGAVDDLATGDFDEDGTTDVVTASLSSGSFVTPGLRILLSDGDGSFSVAGTVDGAYAPGHYNVFTGDFNGDDHIDLISGRNEEAQFYVYLGTGDGSFTSAGGFSFGPGDQGSRRSLGIGDLDQDGDDDFVFGGKNGGYKVGLSNGDGNFTITDGNAGSSIDVFSVAIGDFNGDGEKDAALGMGTTDGNGTPLAGGSVNVLLGDGTGALTTVGANNPHAQATPLGVVNSLAVADFNADGYDDLAASSMNLVEDGFRYDSSVQTWAGSPTSVLGAATVQQETTLPPDPGPTPTRIRLVDVETADFDNDGNQDLTYLNQVRPNGPDVRRASILLGDGTGALADAPGSPFTFGTGSAQSSLGVGDFAGNGAPGLIGGAIGYSGCGGCGAPVLLSAPDVIFDPDSISYDKHKVGTSTAVTRNLVNQGGPTVTVETITLDGNDITQFELSDSAADCFGSLAPASSCPIEVTFKPTSAGVKDAQIRVEFAESETPVVLPVYGEGVTSAASVDPSSLDFGDMRINTTDTETVTVTSSGTGTLEIDQLDVTGTDEGIFSLSDDECSNTNLAPTGTCTVDVTASPTAIGELEATLDIPNDGVGTSSISDLAISANSINPGISVSPTSATLPNAEIDGVGQVAQFTVTSEGTTPLTITGISVSGTNAVDFGTLADQCSGETLDVAETCTFLARFNPEEGPEGTRSANLTIDSNADDLVVPVSGTATRGNTVISPDPVAFGEVKTGQSVSRTVTLTAAGTADMYIDELEITGPDAADYSIGQDGCSEQQTPAGDSCDIELILSPETIGTKEATFTVDTVTQIQDVDLSGSGINPAGSLSPASQDFGSVTIGETGAAKSFRVASSGTTPLEVTSAAISGPDSGSFKLANAAACNGVKSPATNCDLSVSFAPQFGASTARSATLTVVTDAGSFTSSLSGTAVAVPIPPVTTSAKLNLKSAKKVKRGKKLVVTATLKNTGTGTITGIMIGTTVSKKLAKTPKKIKVASLAPGKSVTRKIKVAVKKKAKPGKKLAVTVKAAASGKTLSKSKRVAKIKK